MDNLQFTQGSTETLTGYLEDFYPIDWQPTTNDTPLGWSKYKIPTIAQTTRVKE